MTSGLMAQCSEFDSSAAQHTPTRMEDIMKSSDDRSCRRLLKASSIATVGGVLSPAMFCERFFRFGRWRITFHNPPINMFVPSTIVRTGSLFRDPHIVYNFQHHRKGGIYDRNYRCTR
jgi:hypothetical protein